MWSLGVEPNVTDRTAPFVSTAGVIRFLVSTAMICASLMSTPATAAAHGQTRVVGPLGPNQANPATRASIPEQGPGSRWPGQLWWNDLSTQLELGLTAQQVKKINEVYVKYQTDVKPIVDDLAALQSEFDRLVRERVLDEKALEIRALRLVALRVPLDVSRIVMLYRIYGVLTASQNAQLRQLLEKRGRGR